MNRQSFLKRAISASLYLTFAKPFQLLSQPMEETRLLWNELIDFARWCPTVHNLQPHKLKIISHNEAELYYDPSRLLAIGDPASIFATVALGVFIEHLTIAAAPFHQRIEIVEVYAPVSNKNINLTRFAKLKLVSADSDNNVDRSLIKKRRTSRLQYNGKALAENTLQTLEKNAAQFNHEFFSSSDPELIDWMVALNQKTLFEDLKDKSNREELDKLFRYNEVDAANKKDGLWATCMGFKGSLMQSVFQQHEKWQKGLRAFFLSKQYKHTFNGTSTLAWFSGPFQNTNDWLNAGRMLAINWLSITKDNAYIQPFGSLITNKNAYEAINQQLKSSEDKNKSIWMLFRAGYSQLPARSYRLETNEIIIN
jgi:hypothetical protein